MKTDNQWRLGETHCALCLIRAHLLTASGKGA